MRAHYLQAQTLTPQVEQEATEALQLAKEQGAKFIALNVGLCYAQILWKEGKKEQGKAILVLLGSHSSLLLLETGHSRRFPKLSTFEIATAATVGDRYPLLLEWKSSVWGTNIFQQATPVQSIRTSFADFSCGWSGR